MKMWTVSLQLIYSFLLNSQGRVMFDLFMYKLNNDDVLLEVDKSAEQQLIKVWISLLEKKIKN